MPRDWREALDPGGLVRSGVGWRSISRVSMVSALCYVCWWGRGEMWCSRAVLFVPTQAGKCCPFVCSIMVYLELLLLLLERALEAVV